MIYYLALVLVDDALCSAGQVEEGVRTALAPYDAALRVAPYEEACWCAGDAPCAECGGAGVCLTTDNPQTLWDCWTIGGRWAGLLEGDAARVRDLPSTTWRPYALFYPCNGAYAYLAKGAMGWRAARRRGREEDAHYEEKCAETLSAFPRHLAVVCDLHI